MVLPVILLHTQPIPALMIGGILYAVVLLLLRPLDANEVDQLLQMLPNRIAESKLTRIILGNKQG
jgi:hypothetical protein